MILCCGETLTGTLPGTTAAAQAAYVPCCGSTVLSIALALGRPGARAPISPVRRLAS